MARISARQPMYGSLVSRETIDEIVRTIVHHNMTPEKVMLFGSYANGTPTPDSDLDLLVVMDTDLPRHKRAAPIRLLFRPAPCPMDILVYTPEEVRRWAGVTNHILTDILEEGRVLYERSCKNNEYRTRNDEC